VGALRGTDGAESPLTSESFRGGREEALELRFCRPLRDVDLFLRSSLDLEEEDDLKDAMDAEATDDEATEELDEDLEDVLVRILPLDTRELSEARDASSSSAKGSLSGADCGLCLLT
jgi:hypothetical protein